MQQYIWYIRFIFELNMSNSISHPKLKFLHHKTNLYSQIQLCNLFCYSWYKGSPLALNQHSYHAKSIFSIDLYHFKSKRQPFLIVYHLFTQAHSWSTCSVCLMSSVCTLYLALKQYIIKKNRERRKSDMRAETSEIVYWSPICVICYIVSVIYFP